LAVPVVRLYASITSTNDVARDLAESGAPHLTVVVADHQTHGRGRAGKAWQSQPGSSLLCSVIFRYHAAADAAPGAAPVRVGHAVAGAIQRLTSIQTRVKWPNDVVIPGHGKVSGILCEGAARQSNTYLVAGIGVNLHNPGGDFVALEGLGGHAISRAELLTEIVSRLKQFAEGITRPLSDHELAAMRPRDILFGQAVEDESGVSGRALGIARDGSLLVQTANGLQPLHNATIRLAGSQAYPGTSA
jgi:BirA family biotin operon repressor/biotin-[acetyl-CoA-carboxylase] ligase